MQKFHAVRLLAHADFMEKLDNDRILLSRFVSRPYGSDVFPESQIGCELKMECGTMACVLGWAVFNPTFEGLGLRAVVDKWWNAWIHFTPITAADIVACESDESQYSRLEDEMVKAGTQFFGLTTEQSEGLFIACNVYTEDKEYGGTNKQIAAKLREIAYENFPELQSET